MSRSGYTEDCDDYWQHIMWRGAVKSAIRGSRGQAFLQEMLAALDALPEQKLVSSELEKDGAYCAIGAVGRKRGVDMSAIDPEDPDKVSDVFWIAKALAKEIVYLNDEWGHHAETPEMRFARMRKWVNDQILE